MRRLTLPLLFLISGCCTPAPRTVVVEAPPPQPAYVAPPPQAVAYYGNEHAIPEQFGGGWCYLNGPHEHNYFPDQPANYVVSNGYYYWSAPLAFTYYAGHPLPGGGWCMIVGPHIHDYYPPVTVGWTYRRGSGYVYEGPYRADNPPPNEYWVRRSEPPRPPPGAERAPMHPIYRHEPPPDYHPIHERVDPATAEGEHARHDGDGLRENEHPSHVDGVRENEHPSRVEGEGPRAGEPEHGEHREPANHAEPAHVQGAEAHPAPAPAARKAPPPPPPPAKKKRPGEK